MRGCRAVFTDLAFGESDNFWRGVVYEAQVSSDFDAGNAASVDLGDAVDSAVVLVCADGSLSNRPRAR